MTHTVTELVEIARQYLAQARAALDERNPELARAANDLADAYLENVLRRLEREGDE